MRPDQAKCRQYEKEAAENRRRAGITHMEKNTAAERDWRSHLQTIPRDTRDLTGRIMGDPLPGRSALDQARA